MAEEWKGNLEKIDDYRWRIPKEGGMNVPGLVYADERLLVDIKKEQSLNQVKNVAHLPGINKYSLAMPDIHWGYGFAIGGVAATDVEKGVIAPGGIGYDINCGVRLLRTDLKYDDIKDKIRQLVDALFYTIPSGVGSKGSIHLSYDEAEKVMVKGARWAVEKGYGWKEDLEFTEEGGAMSGANPGKVSHRAIERGLRQLGTLGAGNHFLEIQLIEEIYEPEVAEIFGLEKGQITVMIHTGSRGFGYQVCDDSLITMQRAVNKYGISIPDRQLACAPINSQEGQDYFQAMAAAANYAWANRQCIMHWTREAFEKILGKSAESLGMRLVYDVAHNIAKFEEHLIEGNKVKVCVHRKGA
ncbi:RNA-splicing ligase RtcB, partial [Candidatus Desantisbacteria bacterium CG07_land_8_20_14_0_80_39_15]